MRVFGIDPGFGRIGWGIIEGQKDMWKHIAHGCIETSPKKTFVERLQDVQGGIRKIVDIYKPHHAGVEDLFFAKNVTTGMQVAHARGVILVALADAGIPLLEPTPVQVKQAITGYGKADKRQVQDMVHILLQLKGGDRQDDAMDALAVALTVGVQIR